MAKPNDPKRLTIGPILSADELAWARERAMWSTLIEDCDLMIQAHNEALLEGWAQAMDESDDE